MADDIVTPEGQQATDPSTDNQTPEGGINVPFHEHPRFKELIDEKNTLKAEIETLKTRITPQEEPEPATWKEVEERAVKKATEQMQSVRQKEIEAEELQERIIENGFKQLESLGRTITPEDRKAVLTSMVETGNESVIDTYLKIQKQAKTDERKELGSLPTSKGGTGAGKGYSYKEIKGKSLDQIIQEGL